jgi:hypothetical protein
MKYLLLIATLAAFIGTATATAPSGGCCGGLSPWQRLLCEVTARLKSRGPRRRNPARVFVCGRHFVKMLAVNCQGCDLGVGN